MSHAPAAPSSHGGDHTVDSDEEDSGSHDEFRTPASSFSAMPATHRTPAVSVVGRTPAGSVVGRPAAASAVGTAAPGAGLSTIPESRARAASSAGASAGVARSVRGSVDEDVPPPPPPPASTSSLGPDDEEDPDAPPPPPPPPSSQPPSRRVTISDGIPPPPPPHPAAAPAPAGPPSPSSTLTAAPAVQPLAAAAPAPSPPSSQLVSAPPPSVASPAPAAMAPSATSPKAGPTVNSLSRGNSAEIAMSPPSGPLSPSGGVAARLQNLQRLEAQAKDGRSGSPAHGAAVTPVSASGKTKAQLWKEREQQTTSGASAPMARKHSKDFTPHAHGHSPSEGGAGAAAASGTNVAAAAAASPGTGPAPLSGSALAERAVFATVGASTASLTSAGTPSSGSSAARQPLPLHASTWTGTDGLRCNPHWLATAWGLKGNQLMVVPLDRFDKHLACAAASQHASSTEAAVPSHSSLLLAHHSSILDFAFNPFEANEVATGSADHDAVVKFWTLPSQTEQPPSSFGMQSNGEEGASGANTGLNVLSQPSSILALAKPPHLEVLKVHGLLFNPTAADVLAVSIAPLDVVQVFDISRRSGGGGGSSSQAQQANASCVVGSGIFHAAWSPSGRDLATTSADRLLRLFDLRASHPGAKTGQTSHAISESGKSSRVCWVDGSAATESLHLATLSFTRESLRVLSLWDRRALDRGPTCVQVLDSATMSAPLLHYHSPQRLLILSGKGDASVKFAEVSRDYTSIQYLNEYRCTGGGGGAASASASTAGRPHRAWCLGGPLIGSGPSAASSSASAGGLSPDDLPNIYRMAPLSSSMLPTAASSSASAKDASGGAGGPASFIELVRLRRSDVLHRAIVKRRQTIEQRHHHTASDMELLGGGFGAKYTAEQFFAASADAAAAAAANATSPSGRPGHSKKLTLAPPGSGALGVQPPASSSSTLLPAETSAFDVLVSEVLPRLRDAAAASAFQTQAHANLTAAGAAAPGSGSATTPPSDESHQSQNVSDLLTFKSIVAALSGSAQQAAAQAAATSAAAAALSDKQDEVSELEARVAEMIGAASLAQKRSAATIAALEQRLADALALAGKAPKESKESKKEKEKAAAAAEKLDKQNAMASNAGATGAAADADGAAHHHSHHSHSHHAHGHGHHSSFAHGTAGTAGAAGGMVPSAAALAAASSLAYPAEFEANLALFLSGDSSDDTWAAAAAAAEEEQEIWGWSDMHAPSQPFAPLSPGAPTQHASERTINNLLKPPHPQQLFPCPRLSVGMDLGFAQMHSLIYYQSVSTMHLRVP